MPIDPLIRGCQIADHTAVVPRGTRFPTPPDFWKRQFVPTCALGEPEALFKLVICEIGRGVDGDRRFVWDRAGQVHKVEHGSGRSDAGVVPLNEANPALGYLEPPPPPRATGGRGSRSRSASTRSGGSAPRSRTSAPGACSCRRRPWCACSSHADDPAGPCVLASERVSRTGTLIHSAASGQVA